MHDRSTQQPAFRSRRMRPVRPQPPRMPRYVAVGLAGFFAIVPAAGVNHEAGKDHKPDAEAVRSVGVGVA